MNESIGLKQSLTPLSVKHQTVFQAGTSKWMSMWVMERVRIVQRMEVAVR